MDLTILPPSVPSFLLSYFPTFLPTLLTMQTLYDHIVATIPADNLPILEKTGITLAQAYRNSVRDYEREIDSIADTGMIDDNMKRIGELYSKIEYETCTAELLEMATTKVPQYMPVQNKSAKPMFLQTDTEMLDMFLNTDDKEIYIRLTPFHYTPFTQAFCHVWIHEGTSLKIVL